MEERHEKVTDLGDGRKIIAVSVSPSEKQIRLEGFTDSELEFFERFLSLAAA
jgi:hypothetical protein